MNEEKLCPSWRRMFVSTHDVICTIAGVIWTPVTWVMEQFNGTARMREELKKMK